MSVSVRIPEVLWPQAAAMTLLQLEHAWRGRPTTIALTHPRWTKGEERSPDGTSQRGPINRTGPGAANAGAPNETSCRCPD